jgi:integrase
MDFKVKFTKALVKELKFNPRVVGQKPDGTLITQPVPEGLRDYFINDSSLKGFKIRITANGEKTYYAQKKMGTTFCRYKIGGVSELDLEGSKDEPGARQLAMEALLLIGQGKDPNLLKRQNKIKQNAMKDREKFVFGVAFDDYQHQRKDGNKFSIKTEKDHGQTLRLLGNSQLWKTPFDEITAEIIEDALSPLYEISAATGNKHYRICRAAWRRSALLKSSSSLLPISPFQQWAKAFPPPATPVRETYLETDSTKGKLWLETIAAARNNEDFPQRVYADFLLLTLLWGTRLGEGTTLRREHINFEDRTIVCMDTKNGKNHWLPLTPLVAEVLKNRFEDNDKPRNKKGHPRNHGGWVFPSRISGKHILMPEKLLTFANQTSSLEINTHDLRRSFSGEMWELIGDGLTVKVAMNHSDAKNDVTVGYMQIKPKLNMLRPYFEKREKWLFDLAGIKKAEPVDDEVPLDADMIALMKKLKNNPAVVALLKLQHGIA